MNKNSIKLSRSDINRPENLLGRVRVQWMFVFATFLKKIPEEHIRAYNKKSAYASWNVKITIQLSDGQFEGLRKIHMPTSYIKNYFNSHMWYRVKRGPE